MCAPWAASTFTLVSVHDARANATGCLCGQAQQACLQIQRQIKDADLGEKVSQRRMGMGVPLFIGM